MVVDENAAIYEKTCNPRNDTGGERCRCPVRSVRPRLRRLPLRDVFSPDGTARVVHRQCVESGREIRAQRTGLRTGRGTGASGWQYVDVAECERNALQREFHGGKPVAYILGDTGESPDAHRIFDAARVYLFPKEFVIWG